MNDFNYDITVKKLPCIDCITFVICRGIYNSFPATDRWGAKMKLVKKCSLISDYVFSPTSNRDKNSWVLHAYMQNRDPDPCRIIKNDNK